MSKNIKIGIVGAGIQGVSNALFLQKKGFHVTIFDRDNPGAQAASYGNAGHFSPYASVPINRPDVLTDVPAMLMSSSGPLALKWNYVPKMIPWFLKFIMNSTTNKMMHTAKNMHQILDLALPAYDELFDEIDLEGLVENKGILYIWNDQNLKSRELEINVREELGVKQQLVNKAEIHDLEPHIKPIYHAGVYYPYARHARNPKKILLKLFDLFLKKGGKFNKVNIKDINFDDEKPVFKSEVQSYIFDKAVIACGAFSKKLTDNFGEKIHIEGNFSGPFGYDYSKKMWRGSLEENPTGGMAAMGIHVIDAMIDLLGPIKAVQCISKQQVLKHLDIDDTSSIQLWFSSGATGYLSTLMATAPLWRLQLYGTKAWVTMNGQNETVSNFINETFMQFLIIYLSK